MKYIRTNVYLSEKQRDELKALSVKKGIKVAELTRVAINEYIKRQGGLKDA